MPADRDTPDARPVPLPPGFRHDLLNALNAVIGYATLLRMDLPDGKPRQWADRILIAAEEAQALAEKVPSGRAAVRGRRVLLVAGGPAGDAIELALDRQGWEPLRAMSWAEAAEVLSTGAGDLDLVLADAALSRPETVPGGLPAVTFQAGDSPEDVAGRLISALD